jgi:CheY-like chemotaxis protein
MNHPETRSPLDIKHITDVLAQIDPIAASHFDERVSQLLNALYILPQIDSAYLVTIDTDRQTYRLSWLEPESRLREGDELELFDSTWQAASQVNSPLLEKIAANMSHESLESLESGEQTDAVPQDLLNSGDGQDIENYRYILPIYQQKSHKWLIAIQSMSPAKLALWNVDLLKLLCQQINYFMRMGDDLDGIKQKWSRYQRRISFSPPALESALVMAQTSLRELQPISAIVQHNIDALSTYHRHLLNALDYYTDEIKLYATSNAFEDIQNFNKNNQINDISSDLEPLLQDLNSSLFQFRYFLNILRDIQQAPQTPEKFLLSEILQPLLSLLFANKSHQIEYENKQTMPVHGHRNRLQHALMMLFVYILRQIEMSLVTGRVQINASEQGNQLCLTISIPIEGHSDEVGDEDEYIFAKRVVEEHQGSFVVTYQRSNRFFRIYLPIMFEHSPPELHAYATPKSFDVVGAIPSKIDSSDSIPELPKISTKVLLLSSDLIFSRALRRVLSGHFELYLASNNNIAFDIISAHPDLAMILCDLQESGESSLELLDELRSREPDLAQHVTFLKGHITQPEIEDFAKLIYNRCCERHASVDTLIRFISRKLRVA